MTLSSRLHHIAVAFGVAGFGVCTAESFTDVEAELRNRAASGLNGSLGFTYNDPAVATRVQETYSWARCLVVVAVAYLPDAGSPGTTESNTGRIARFATADHYVPLREVLGRLAAELEAAGHRAAIFCDDNRLVDRAAAVRAGVGWWAKSAMVLVPGAGPWTLLGAVVTDAELETTGPMRRDCGTCVACIPACPTGAIVEPGVLDARLCLAHWAQAPGIIPRDLRTAMGDRIYGCDDCLTACPPGGRLLQISTRVRGRRDLMELLGYSDAALLDEFGHFYIPRRNPRYLRRNLLVALGNAGDESALAILAGYAGHPDWLLRLHATWALGALASNGAAQILAAARTVEDDDRVIEENRLASAEIGDTRR